MTKFQEVEVKQFHVFENALGQFLTEIRKKGKRQIIDAGGHWIQPPSATTLLKLRKGLVARIKQGMLKRQNVEIEIGLQAFLVWYHRQELEKAQRTKLEDIAIQDENEDTGEKEAWDAVRKLGHD